VKSIFYKSFVTIICLLILIVPIYALAQNDTIIPCGFDGPDPGTVVGDSPGEQCGFNHLLGLTINIIRLLINLSLALATIAFVWAGFLLVTSGGNVSKKEEAKAIFAKVFTGFLIVLSAWLIVWTITNTLLKSDYILLQGKADIIKVG